MYRIFTSLILCNDAFQRPNVPRCESQSHSGWLCKIYEMARLLSYGRLLCWDMGLWLCFWKITPSLWEPTWYLSYKYSSSTFYRYHLDGVTVSPLIWEQIWRLVKWRLSRCLNFYLHTIIVHLLLEGVWSRWKTNRAEDGCKCAGKPLSMLIYSPMPLIFELL